MAEPALGRTTALMARPWAGAAAIVLLAVALSPPVHGAAGSALVAHMVQHIALLTVAPPLLVLGLGLRTPSHPPLGLVVVLHSAVLVGWHLPALYDAAVQHEAVHVVEHLTLFGAGVLLWWVLGVGDGAIGGASILALFVAALPGTLLGAAMTFSSHPWYASYPDPIDQQVAGVLMWGPAGTAYALAAGALLMGWMRAEGAEE